MCDLLMKRSMILTGDETTSDTLVKWSLLEEVMRSVHSLMVDMSILLGPLEKGMKRTLGLLRTVDSLVERAIGLLLKTAVVISRGAFHFITLGIEDP